MAGAVPLGGLGPSTGPVPAASQVPSSAQVPQVGQVPVGAVHAGDGSTSPGSQPSPLLLGTALALVAAGATGVVVAGRRRHRQP